MINKDYSINYWIKTNEIDHLNSSEYWNDKKLESKKMWSIPNNDFKAFENYFSKKGLYQQFISIIKNNRIDLKNKTVLSLASGTCALESKILKNFSKINKMICVEFSIHRIKDIAPKILNHYSINPKKIDLNLGSFYNLDLDDNSIDLIILSQAFHHADQPHSLLCEIKRVLKKNGKVIMIGEHHFNFIDVVKKVIFYYFRFFKSNNYHNKKLIPNWQSLFPPDKIKGDIHYSNSEYRKFFKEHGFAFKRQLFKDFKRQGFCLEFLK